MKKLSHFLSCVLLCTFSLITYAQSGKTGKLRWNISNGTLTISGVGAMPNYKYQPNRNRINSPWYYYLKDITNVVIYNGVSSIGDNAFYANNNDDLLLVTVFGSDTAIDEYYSDRNGLVSVSIPNSVTSIGIDAFRGCNGLTSIIIPNSVITIGSGAFSGCFGLTSITIPNSVTTIESYIFDCCSSLNSVTLSYSATVVRYAAFRGCNGLMSVSIPNSVTTIGGHAFAFSRSLKSVTIPKSVIEIANNAFSDCDNLEEIIIHATEPPKIKPFNAFSNIDKVKCTLYVPTVALPAYRIVNGWKDFENIESFNERVDKE